MSFVVRICLILFGIAYLISPIDIVPDLLIPYLGWLDDGLVIWGIYHLIRNGKLPWSQKGFPSSGASAGFGSNNANANANTKTRNANGPDESRTSAPHGKTVFSVSSACKVLGISPRASWQEIQAAYREKSKKYHPDRVSHLGKEFAELANEKFIEIQNAYELLKREKGR